ncbi:hypothetical protein AB0J14_05080 [Micromonospora arborensis]|uniref:hypothetical protein n=1 Tax=Micromonospora arborensis TaxID=2116518 RepID=UPI0033F2E622
MGTSNLTLVWADRPSNPRIGTTASVAEAGVRGYRYYQRQPNGVWHLIAVAANEREAADWYYHRTDPVEVPAELAVWLDSVVAR